MLSTLEPKFKTFNIQHLFGVTHLSAKICLVKPLEVLFRLLSFYEHTRRVGGPPEQLFEFS